MRTLIDVRAFPVSRRHPQFSRPALESALADQGIAYAWQGKALGGYRKIPYSEHTRTPAFRHAVAALGARTDDVCIMCAESKPEDCHRLHIADWLAARGHQVVHLLAPGRTRAHVLNPQEDLWRED